MSEERNSVIAYLDITIKYGQKKIDLSLPIIPESSTIGELKEVLEQHTQVPRLKQRLLFNAPVRKEFRRDPDNSTKLRSLLSESVLRDLESCSSPVPKHIRITVMLLGSQGTVAVVDSKASSEISRLVSATVEQEGRLYRCSYYKGYLQQTAYVCRTCVQEGRADPAHAVCAACTEVCHWGHEVEVWGVRYYMRCDCCTKKCWKPIGEPHATKTTDARDPVSHSHGPDGTAKSTSGQSENASPALVVSTADVERRTGSHNPFRPDSPGLLAKKLRTEPSNCEDLGLADNEEDPEQSEPEAECPSRCVYVIDRATKKPPVNAVLPVNRKNRYPRQLTTWCYCEKDYPDDADGGIACMLCSTCFWAEHLTRIFADQYRYTPCYGDVVHGTVLAFKCNTCKTYICTPCRLRCHKDHAIEPGFIIPDPKKGTSNNTTARVSFSCGCSDVCGIRERVPDEEVDNPVLYMSIPDDIKTELLNSDVFVGMICAHCMQEYPWLMREKPTHCFQGQLPPKVTDTIKPVVTCKEGRSTGELPPDVFPYHGMLLPVDFFTAEGACPCEPCQKAFSEFAPREEYATEMIVDQHSTCDNCGIIALENGKAFLCRTCELNREESFFICKNCNALRLQAILERSSSRKGSTQGAEEATPLTNVVSSSRASSSSSRDQIEDNAVGAITYKHDLSHDFIEDTYDNIITLCQMHVIQSLEVPLRQLTEENLESVRDAALSITASLHDSFRQMPLNFDEEDMQALQEDNVSSPSRKNWEN